MLNKLFYYRNQAALDKNSKTESMTVEEASEQVLTGLNHILQQRGLYGEISPVSGGTLGITYLVRCSAGKLLFAKTHIPEEAYRLALKQEYWLFKTVYGQDLYLELIDVNDQSYMFMDLLMAPQQKILPDEVLQMTNIFATRTSKLSITSNNLAYSIEDLLENAQKESDVLYAHGLLSKELKEYSLKALHRFERKIPDLQRCICHGDLSDKNILETDTGKRIAIDWEDGFWGIPGYDYLYWLTFFNHRCFCEREYFLKAGYSLELTTEILLMILILKSAISFYSGNYLKNSMSIEMRIEEMLNKLGEI